MPTMPTPHDMGRSALTRRPGAAGWADDSEGRSLISVSHMGRVELPDRVAGAELRVATVGRPLGLHGISLNAAECGNRLHVTATFHPRFVRPATVAQASCP